MPAPSTVNAAGFYLATRAGAAAGDAALRMTTATRGTLGFGGLEWNVTGDPATKKLRGTASGSVVDLRIVNRSLLKGTVDGAPLELARAVQRPIPAAEMAQSDPGPAGSMKAIMDATPDYRVEVGDATTFWYAFGPVLYRGRLDGTARVLGIASGCGPAECLPFARRALVGDSGQKTQGFLARLGLTRSYTLVNGFAVALRPSKKTKGMKVLRENAAIRAARHALYDGLLAGGALQAIVAFGDVAHKAYDLWAAANPAVKDVPSVKVAHPAAIDRLGNGNDPALKAWAKAITTLRSIVTADPDGDASARTSATTSPRSTTRRIPRWDLPSAAPIYMGNDDWGRVASPRHNNCCERPSPDDKVSLLLSPPVGSGEFLRYRYENGQLIGAKRKNGRKVNVDAFGIPT